MELSNQTVTRNQRTIVGSGQTYRVTDTDDILDIDTTNGGITIILQSIQLSGLFGVLRSVTINDISDNAATNNIIIQSAPGEKINSAASISLTTNGANIKCTIANKSEWIGLGTGVITSITGANNGLSVTGTTVQLGGTLIQNTSIVQAGFTFSITGGFIGLGTLTPSATAHIDGTLRYVDGNEGADKILVSDANGNATWQDQYPSYTEVDPVLSIIPIGSAVTTVGNRYIASATGGGWTINNIYEWDGAMWVETVAVLDYIVEVTSLGAYRRFNGTTWVPYGGTAILQGGNSLGSAMSIGTKTNQVFYVRTNNSNRVRITNTQMNITGGLFVGALTTTINASAIVELTSTTKGILLPRMTEAEKNAIPSPATGLLLFQTNNTPGYYYYTGSVWTMLDSNSSDWNLDGNTVGSEKWLGTIDNFALPIRTNNTEVARFTAASDFVIGTTTASAKLHVRGSNTSSGTAALLVQNATPTNMLSVQNDGAIWFNGGVGNNGGFEVRQVSGKNLIMDVYNNGFGRRHFSIFDNGGATAMDNYVSVGGRPADFPVATFYPAANANYGSLHLNSSGGSSYQLFSNRGGASYNHLAFINGAGGGLTIIQNASQHYEIQLQSYTGVGTNMLLSSDSDSYLAGISTANLGVGIAPSGSKFHIKGSGNDNTTYWLKAQNSDNEILYTHTNGGIIEHYTNTAVGASVTDGYLQYSADIVAGNAAPHFKTEAGNIIKLFTSPAYTITNLTTDRSYNANVTNIGELADVLGTLITDLKATGLIG